MNMHIVTAHHALSTLSTKTLCSKHYADYTRAYLFHTRKDAPEGAVCEECERERAEQERLAGITLHEITVELTCPYCGEPDYVYEVGRHVCFHCRRGFIVNARITVTKEGSDAEHSCQEEKQ